jgi:hypothetical protein
MPNDLVYTTTYKSFNLKTESPSIQISNKAWIETSPDYVGQPNVGPALSGFLGMPSDIRYGLSKFQPALIESATQLRVTSAAEEEEKNPFDRDECAYIATALSILHDDWFVVGLESFSNSRDPQNPSLGPFCTFFIGEKNLGGCNVLKADEVFLIKCYDFVYNSLTDSSWQSANAKLIFLYLKCVTRSGVPNAHVLKIGLSHLFTEWHEILLFAYLFFEHVFSEESNSIPDGVDLWNKIFGAGHGIDGKLVRIVMAYRNVIAHNNATRSLARLAEWKQSSGYDDQAAYNAINEFIPKVARTIVRAIISEEVKYLDFLKQRQQIS